MKINEKEAGEGSLFKKTFVMINELSCQWTANIIKT